MRCITQHDYILIYTFPISKNCTQKQTWKRFTRNHVKHLVVKFSALVPHHMCSTLDDKLQSKSIVFRVDLCFLLMFVIFRPCCIMPALFSVVIYCYYLNNMLSTPYSFILTLTNANTFSLAYISTWEVLVITSKSCSLLTFYGSMAGAMVAETLLTSECCCCRQAARSQEVPVMTDWLK